jgi:hypothetical protein
MRKALWCCAAAAAVLTGGVTWTVYHGIKHPDSCGRMLSQASRIGLFMSPLGIVSHLAGEPMVGSCETEAAGDWLAEGIPEEPQPVEAAEELVPVLPLAGALELPAAALAPPIVINEDDPLHEPIMCEPGNDQKLDLTAFQVQAGLNPEVPSNTCPMVMPYCTDEDEAPAQMPYATDDEPAAGYTSEKQDRDSWFFRIWSNLLPKKVASEEAPPEDTDVLCPDQCPGMGDCKEDSHYHHQYPGCPHTVCPYTGRSYPDEAMTPPSSNAAPSGSEEGSETKPAPKKMMHKSKKVDSEQDGCPKHPDVDTMEFRPSDRQLNEHGPGGPF